jgi:hypothetical protein
VVLTVLVNLLLRWYLWLDAFSSAGPSEARLFTRQERIVHGVLARVLHAAQVRCVVRPVRSCGAE